MTVREAAFMSGMEAMEAIVSVGWQWASWTPRCQGKLSSWLAFGVVIIGCIYNIV